MIKTIAQVTFIVLRKTVERVNSLAHGVVYLTLLAVYIMFSYKLETYNYDRIWLWNVLALTGAFWTSSLAVIETRHSHDLAYVIILFSGYLVIVIVGAVLQ
jgi:hypothetical protein